MARACELFAMDLAKRSELYMQNQSSTRRTVGLVVVIKVGRCWCDLSMLQEDLLGAVERTDYCDFLLDVARRDDVADSEFLFLSAC